MCPACWPAIVVAGSGAGLLLWFRRNRQAKPDRSSGPPTATFKEWVAAVVSLEEALRATGPQLPAGREAPSQFNERL